MDVGILCCDDVLLHDQDTETEATREDHAAERCLRWTTTLLAITATHLLRWDLDGAVPREGGLLLLLFCCWLLGTLVPRVDENPHKGNNHQKDPDDDLSLHGHRHLLGFQWFVLRLRIDDVDQFRPGAS